MKLELEAPDHAEARAVAECIEYFLGELPVAISRYPSSSSRHAYRVRMGDREVVLKSIGGPRKASVSCAFASREMRAGGVPTPTVLGSESGNKGGFGLLLGRPFVITEPAPGERLDVWLGSEPDRAAVNTAFADLGRVLRRLHALRALRGFGKIDDHGVGDCKDWWTYLDRHRVSHRHGGTTRVLDLRDLVAAGLLDADRARHIELTFTPENPLLDQSEARLLHNDVTLRNVFVDPSEARVTALIDLHNVIAGAPSLDLARFAYFYLDRDYLAPLLEGYGSTSDEARATYLIYVLLEKVQWLTSRQQRFPGRLGRDLERLFSALDAAP